MPHGPGGVAVSEQRFPARTGRTADETNGCVSVHPPFLDYDAVAGQRSEGRRLAAWRRPSMRPRLAVAKVRVLPEDESESNDLAEHLGCKGGNEKIVGAQ